jgi:hypothetical protein
MSGYTVRLIEELPSVPGGDPGDPVWRPIQHVMGLTAFGLNAYTARTAGDELLGEHDESGSGQEEVYVVLAGRAAFRIGDDAFEAAAGSVVAIRDPTLRRSAVAAEPGTTLLAIGAAPDRPFATTWLPHHFAEVPRDVEPL